MFWKEVLGWGGGGEGAGISVPTEAQQDSVPVGWSPRWDWQLVNYKAICPVAMGHGAETA